MRTVTYAFPVFLFLLLLPSSGKRVNVTIDDFFGDPTNNQKIQYFPSAAWQSGNGCERCTAKPTPASSAWLGTWHDSSFNPNDTATNSALGQIIVASAQFSGEIMSLQLISDTLTMGPIRNCGLCQLHIDEVILLSQWKHGYDFFP